jgi:polar amino acid transport system substrate-binding protein
MTRISAFWLLVMLVVLVAGCGAPASAPAAAAVPTVAVPYPVSTAASAAQLAGQGQAVFSANCARCHGDKGQGSNGPLLIGAGSRLAAYDTAQGLYDFVRANMPKSSPGNLKQEEYLQVMSFLLVQNGLIAPATPVDLSGLGKLSLKK